MSANPPLSQEMQTPGLADPVSPSGPQRLYVPWHLLPLILPPLLVPPRTLAFLVALLLGHHKAGVVYLLGIPPRGTAYMS